MVENEKEPKNPFLTTKEVAYIFRVSPRTIHNYRKDLKLPYYQISKKNILYQLSDVVALMRNSNSSIYLKEKLEKYASSFIQLE